MARRFAKVSEDEIEEAFFYPSDLVNTKTTIPLRVGEEAVDIYLDASRLGIYPPLFTSPSGDSCIIYLDQFLRKFSLDKTYKVAIVGIVNGDSDWKCCKFVG